MPVELLLKKITAEMVSSKYPASTLGLCVYMAKKDGDWLDASDIPAITLDENRHPVLLDEGGIMQVFEEMDVTKFINDTRYFGPNFEVGEGEVRVLVVNRTLRNAPFSHGKAPGEGPMAILMTRQGTRAQQKMKRSVRRKVGNDASGNTLELQALSLDDPSDQVQAAGDHVMLPPASQEPMPRAKKKRGSKTIKIYKGFRYCKNWYSKKHIAYRCSTSKTSGCKATLKVTPAAVWWVEGEHTCRPVPVLNGQLNDETDAMKRTTDQLATQNPTMPEGDIWEQVCEAFYGPDREELLDGLTEEQVIGRIRRIRRRYYGGDIHGVVEVPPFSKVKDSAIPFFRFHLTESMYDDILHLIYRDTGKKLNPTIAHTHARYYITEWNVFGIANTIVARTNNPLERFNKEMNAAFKPHPKLRHFVSTIAKFSTAYAQRQANITRDLRKKKQRPPRIELPAAPDLATFEVPPESEDEGDYDELGDQSDGSVESADHSSEEDEPPRNAQSAEDLQQEIDEHANTYNFFLDSDSDHDPDEENGVEEWSF
ncbi:hypothetical protein PHYSODRAFT_326600 [Phytophthora sojae]|uniref:FLYWCH-type domain-containing protein n=1 Tax=Phytophthora sojae (strain P6497) TaxID=1094619 RepID=G4YWG3_PHYSP|nr:hypothetical protein PHYSODRAFT_326600 [Phytophthora sojae]EGZ25609.1 hypothetical protein PHYSODRAFT_326600 [Phytophthora sojae]|eukprot:XP_009520897.1 hypothetical protein PHYSODRAFT_326600 [Phytophthora sojae]